jgi:hypothetical protein
MTPPDGTAPTGPPEPHISPSWSRIWPGGSAPTSVSSSIRMTRSWATTTRCSSKPPALPASAPSCATSTSTPTLNHSWRARRGRPGAGSLQRLAQADSPNPGQRPDGLIRESAKPERRVHPGRVSGLLPEAQRNRQLRCYHRLARAVSVNGDRRTTCRWSIIRRIPAVAQVAHHVR